MALSIKTSAAFGLAEPAPIELAIPTLARAPTLTFAPPAKVKRPEKVLPVPIKLTLAVGMTGAEKLKAPVNADATALLNVMLRFAVTPVTTVPAGIPAPVTVEPTVTLPVYV